jgi:hypothetical protein
MSLERADFVGLIWLTTPVLLLSGSRIQRQHRWLLLIPFLALCITIVLFVPYGNDTAKNYTFGTGQTTQSFLSVTKTMKTDDVAMQFSTLA